MGLKLRGVLRCGACGKPRGLGTHLCNPGRRKRRRTTLQNPVTWQCPSCHKSRGLIHTCAPKSDFKKRKRAAARKRATDERRRRRKAVRERQAARRRQAAAGRRARERARRPTKTRTPRPRPPAHDYHVCRDEDCGKYGCTAFRDGVATGTSGGLAAGHAQGHAEGYAEGRTEGYSEGYGDGAAEGGSGDSS